MDRFVRMLPGPLPTDAQVALKAEFSTQVASSPLWTRLQDEAGIPVAERLTQSAFDEPLSAFATFCYDSGVLCVPRDVHLRMTHARCGGLQWQCI